MLALCAEQVSFRFGDRPPLLLDIGLQLAVGEQAVIVGRNGSGKTTLLRLLAGLLSPATGRVWIEGDTTPAVRGRVGILFQNPDHQMIAPTVEEEIALGLELRGVPSPEVRAAVDELLRRFRLEDLRTKPPEALSGGQKQRVALAAVAAVRPPFLLLDEPDSFLDAPARRDLLRLIGELRPECGLLWVMPQGARLPDADRIYFLERGRLEPCSYDELQLRLAASPTRYDAAAE